MAQFRQREEPFDFTGYILFDELDPGLKPSDIWVALASVCSTAQETRFLVSKKLSAEMCAIFKFCNEEEAQEVIQRCRQRVPLNGLRGLNVAAGLKALSDLERALTGLVEDDVFETDVRVQASGFRGGSEDLITSALSPFGEIFEVTEEETSDLGVIFSVKFKYYSSALASQLACHGTKIRRKDISVVPLRKRVEVTNTLLEWATKLLEPDQKNKLEVALLNVSF